MPHASSFMKLEAKKLLEQYQIPTAPWGEVDLKDTKALAALCTKIGFPVLLKAASGGGGKGMRLVQNADALNEASAELAVILDVIEAEEKRSQLETDYRTRF